MRIIAGPCQHETLEHSLKIAKYCEAVCYRHKVDYIFKASFDKANRTSIQSQRGLGLIETLADFLDMKSVMPTLAILTDFHTVKIKSELDVPITTDFHESWQAEILKDNVDLLQIPAFLCRQTDLILEACKLVDEGIVKHINIKKGQFLAPWDVEGILSKVNLPRDKVWITERGTSFGYNTLVVDFTGLCYMLDSYDVPIVMDATHSVQRPGGNGTTSGGNREYVHRIAMAAKAVGVDNFFFEVHTNPDEAPSDGPNSLTLPMFEDVVSSLTA